MSAGRKISVGRWLLKHFSFAIGLFIALPCCAQTPTEIVELARALKNDPDLIYEYVYNNIETLPQYGSAKGPLGALLDGKGTAFDQAELMVALLQQAGFAASYQIGKIQLTAAQVTNWLGTDTSYGSIYQTFLNGGFPGDTISSGGIVSAVQISSAWVVVNIGGTNYVFDPSTKTYSRSAGIGFSALISALGYSQSALISASESGATITSTSITALNRTNVRNNLSSYANNLTRYIRANMPAATPADIFGGTTIVPLAIGTQLRQTSLSYAVAGTVSNQTAIPSAYRTTLTLTLGYYGSGGTFATLAGPVTFNSSDTTIIGW